MQQRVSTCNAKMFLDKFKEDVARITGPLRTVPNLVPRSLVDEARNQGARLEGAYFCLCAHVLRITQSMV